MKLKKFKERNNKRIGIIVFTITCILLVSGVILYRTFAIFEVKTNQNIIKGAVQDPGDIYFAYYVDDVIQKDMPQKDSGYILDEEKSYCGELGSTDKSIIPTLNEEDWSITVKGMKQSRTKCNLYFRNYYKVKVNEQEHQVPTSSKELTIEKTGSILLCNNGITAKEEEDGIHLSNITKDSTCHFYDTSNNALEKIDDTKNYILFLNDETQSTLTIPETNEVTIDLNGHTIKGIIDNLGSLYLKSSKEDKGILENNTSSGIHTAINSVTNIENIKINSRQNVISGIANIKSSEISCINTENDSTIYTSSTSNILLVNSKVSGPYAIGGSGGKITVDNSEIIGTLFNGITVNKRCKGDIIIKNESNITGKNSGIVYSGYGTLKLDGTIDATPAIKGTQGSGLGISKVLLEWNYGEIFGNQDSIIPSSCVTRTGTTIVTEDKDGMKHTFLQ